MTMQWDGRRRPVRHVYRQEDATLTLVGSVLAAAGLLLMFVCIPGWAWAVLAGVALIAAGYALIRLGRTGR